MSYFFNNLDIINFLNNADINSKDDLCDAEFLLSEKEPVSFVLENIDLLSNLSAKEVFLLSPYRSDPIISSLAISKDPECLKFVDQSLLKNKQFMDNIVEKSKGIGIYYLKGDNQTDQKLIEKYLLEIFVNDEIENFPQELSTKLATETYNKVINKLCFDNDIKTQMIDYYKTIEKIYLSNIEENKKDVLEKKLSIISNKIAFLAQKRSENLLNNNLEK